MAFVKVMHPHQVEFLIHPAGAYYILPYSSWFLNWIGWRRYQQAGSTVKIVVSSYGIQTADGFITAASIRKVAVRNDMDETPNVYSWLRKKLHSVAYRVDIECDRICYIVASGLTEEDANFICTDVYKILSDSSETHPEAISARTAG